MLDWSPWSPKTPDVQVARSGGHRLSVFPKADGQGWSWMAEVMRSIKASGSAPDEEAAKRAAEESIADHGREP